MAKHEDLNSGKIKVADITIAQLSQGLYRSTATAFKELVSNAFDADAKTVRIDTNYPQFDFISCMDDGRGMPRKEFLRYFSSEGIGSCTKRRGGRRKTSQFGRPIIGRLGIGMLAVGQLCHSFEIESHYRENSKGRAYRATIVLRDQDIPNVDELVQAPDEAPGDLQVGTWQSETIEYDQRKQGFRIHSSDVRKTFTREMKSSIEARQDERMSFDLADLHARFYSKTSKSVRDLGAYLECIWELSSLCPLPYAGPADSWPIDLSAFTDDEAKKDEFTKAKRFLRQRQKQLEKHNFCVLFDGINLRRHIQLPTQGDTHPRLYYIDFDDEVFGQRLAFRGYLFAQVPRAVRPADLNGVQIRLRGVGIGGYDRTFLRYSEQIDTIRSRWVSGEVFVDQGLESALNIDRDSFNEHDEQFKKLQEVLHKKLRVVFEEIDRIARGRTDGIRESKEKRVRSVIGQLIAKRSGGKLRLHQRNMGDDVPLVTVDESKGEVVLNIGVRPLKKKKANQILGAVMLAYHTAQRTPRGGSDPETVFYELLQEVLSELT